MKKYYKLIIPAILLILFLIKVLPLMDVNSRCVTYDDFLNEYYNGVVVKKYIDSSEHSYKTVEIKNFGNSEVDKLILDFDTTDLYDRLNLNDSIYKQTGKDSIFFILSGRKVFISRADFGCRR